MQLVSPSSPAKRQGTAVIRLAVPFTLALLVTTGWASGNTNSASEPAKAHAAVRQQSSEGQANATPRDSIPDAGNAGRKVRRFLPRLAKEIGPPNYFLLHRELARPRLGLALSGGGARALSQIGMLQVLEEHNLPIDFIVGTSMGSIIGGLYAAGYSAKQLREIIHNIPWDDINVDTPPRTSLFLAQKQERNRAFLQVRFRGFKPYIPPALNAGQKLLTVLTELTMRANYRASSGFDNLRIPFRAVTTDLYSGKQILISDGDLAEAMRASVAIPFLFAPVPRGSMLLADGGLVNNIPVDVARQFTDIVIAVDATSKLRDKQHLNAPWEIADQVTTIMQRDQNEAQRQKADVLITIGEESRTSTDFTNLDSLIDLGYRLTLEQLDKIRRLLQQQKNNGHKIAGANEVFAVQNFLVQNNNSSLTEEKWNPGPAIYNAQSKANRNAGTFWQPFPVEASTSGSTRENDGGLLLSAEEIQNWGEAIYATGQYATVHAELRADSLILFVEENPRLQQVYFSGNTAYSDSTLLACMQSRPGEIINHQRSYEDLTAIVERYRNDGYALAEIRAVRFDSTTGLLQINIDEGRIAEIEIEGLHRTQKVVVSREFPLKSGDIFNSNLCSRGIRNIHSTGLFDQVTLNIRGSDNGAVVKIKVQEKPFQVLRLGGRYDSERKTRGFLEVGDENAFGIGSKFFGYIEKGSRDQLARLSWRNDRILKSYISFAASVYHQEHENFVYDTTQRDPLGEYLDRRIGAHFALGQQVRRIGAVSAELRSEKAKLIALSGGGYPAFNSTLNSFILRSIVDTQDRLPFPRRGRYVHAFYEYVNSELGAKDSFFRFFTRIETFHSRGPHTVHPKLSLGTSDQTTPFSEQFRLGGPNEVYGLRDQELVGRHFVLGSLEYRYQIRRRPLFDSYLSLRYDLSGLWIDRRDANYRKFRHALGMSLALYTPLGPFSIAFGRYENRQHRVYFSAGFNF
jgi:NTE family protein